MADLEVKVTDAKQPDTFTIVAISVLIIGALFMLSGLMVQITWEHTIPVMLPRLTSVGYIAASLTYGQALWVALIPIVFGFARQTGQLAKKD